MRFKKLRIITKTYVGWNLNTKINIWHKSLVLYPIRIPTSWVPLVCWVAAWSVSPRWSAPAGTIVASSATCLWAWWWSSSCSTTWSPEFNADNCPNQPKTLSTLWFPAQDKTLESTWSQREKGLLFLKWWLITDISHTIMVDSLKRKKKDVNGVQDFPSNTEMEIWEF